MQTFRFKQIFSLAVAGGLIAALSACNGGGGSVVVVTNPSSGGYVVSTGSSGGYVSTGSSGGYVSTGSSGGSCGAYGCDSAGAISRDGDLEQAQAQQNNVDARAQLVAQNFSMSVTSATQLVQLADRVKAMGDLQALTAQDREAVSNAAYGIAGVTADQVNDAVQKASQGDNSAAEAVMANAAKNLGMPSASALRDQLLPALGFDVNH